MKWKSGSAIQRCSLLSRELFENLKEKMAHEKMNDDQIIQKIERTNGVIFPERKE